MEAFTLASPGGWHAINEDRECEEKHRSGCMQARGEMSRKFLNRSCHQRNYRNKIFQRGVNRIYFKILLDPGLLAH